jgi:hypothetical protein
MLVVVLYFKERNPSEASKLCGNDLYNSHRMYLKPERGKCCPMFIAIYN